MQDIRHADQENLFAEQGHLSDDAIASITEEMVRSLPEMIADYHVATLGLRANAERCDALSAALGQSDDRQVFVAILARARRDKDADHGAIFARQLSAGHPVRHWALGGKVEITLEMLIDRGGASAFKEAMS